MTACEHSTLLLPFQTAWIADDSPVCVCDKSRRIGITWAEALRAVLVASCPTPRLEIVPGRTITARQDVWYQVYSIDDGREFMEYVHEFAVMHNSNMRARGVRWRELDVGRDLLVRYVRFPETRKRITVIAGKPRSWRNKGGVAVIDEAEFLDDLDGSIAAVRPYIARGGRLRIMSSVGESGSVMGKLVHDISTGFSGTIPVTSNSDGTVLWAGDNYAYHRYTLEHANKQGCMRREFDRKGEAWTPEAEAKLVMFLYHSPSADREYKCIRSRRGDSYIPQQWIAAARRPRPVFRWTFPIELREVPDSDVERKQRREAWRVATISWMAPVIAALSDSEPLYRNRIHYICQDYASRSHTSAIALAADVDGVLDVRIGIELLGAPQDVQQHIIELICENVRTIIAGGFDERSNGETHIEELRWSVGAHMRGYSQTEQWYRETIPTLRRLFENGEIIIPDDDQCAGDFARYELKPNGVPVMGAPLGARHGDFAQAVSMGVRARIDVPPPLRLTVNDAPDDDGDDDDEGDLDRY